MNKSRLKDISKLLDLLEYKLANKLVNYEVSKKNKQIQVKDLYITYNLTFWPDINCPCGRAGEFYCNHVLYVLAYVWHLPDYIIAYLVIPHMRNKFFELAKTNKFDKIRDDLIKAFKKYMHEEECGICLLSLDDKLYNLDLFECPRCHKFVHTKCMTQWLITKKKQDKSSNNNNNNIIERGCIFCLQEIQLDKLP